MQIGITEVPLGSFKLSIDKIGLRIGSQYLDRVKAKAYQTGVITILFFGNTAQINIHAEFDMVYDNGYEKNHALRCYRAVYLLVKNEIFTEDFEDLFYRISKRYQAQVALDESVYTQLLNELFSLVELEIALDFYDIPILKKPNIECHPDFNIYRKTTFYSLDWRRPRRNRNGKNLSKGRQQSFLCIYDRSKKVKARLHRNKRKIIRLEMRYQGKYKRYLPMDLLGGIAEDVFYTLRPSMEKILKKLIKPDNLEFTQEWLENAPDILVDFIKTFDKGLIERLIEERRKEEERASVVPVFDFPDTYYAVFEDMMSLFEDTNYHTPFDRFDTNKKVLYKDRQFTFYENDMILPRF